VFDRHRLGDHPAHRRPDDVCLFDAEVIEEPDPVGSHVGKGVRHRHVRRVRQLQSAENGGQHGRQHGRQVGGLTVEFARQPTVAVVEADHVPPALGDQPAETFVPCDHLCREPHHEQQSGVFR